VFISMTIIQVTRFRDLPGVYLTGLRLRRTWPKMPGAVGLLLWARPWERRSCAISVWLTEADLRSFVSWPVHVAVMRKYRNHATVTTESWPADRFIAAVQYQAARQGATGALSELKVGARPRTSSSAPSRISPSAQIRPRR
jgi:hypothetical protein